jgi:LacI family transcriptional regulator
MAKVTLESIATKMGVSTVAVFKALNNQKGVSEKLRKKIKAYAKSAGYVNKTSKIGIMKKRFLFFIRQDFFLTPSEQFYSTIFYFLSAECNQANSILQVAFIEEEQTLAKINMAISSFKPDGIFFAGEVGEKIIKEFAGHSIPTIFIDYYSPIYGCNYIFVDNYQMSYMLTKYLIQKGHRRIGFIGDIGATNSIADRYFGYLKALKEEKLEVNPNWHINENIERKPDLVSLPKTDQKPTAYVCHCDSAAQRLYAMLAMNNLRIPYDVSVVSFDNTNLCDSLMPKLTSIGLHKDSCAKKAFSAMAEALKSKKTSVIQVKAHLVERESTASI